MIMTSSVDAPLRYFFYIYNVKHNNAGGGEDEIKM